MWKDKVVFPQKTLARIIQIRDRLEAIKAKYNVPNIEEAIAHINSAIKGQENRKE